MATRLTRQNRAGWMMAGPAFLLIVVFLILPFIMAIGFSFTNQRLVSPNPREWVGARNYERLFSMAMLTLEAERDESGAVKMMDGEPVYPRLRRYTRNLPIDHLAPRHSARGLLFCLRHDRIAFHSRAPEVGGGAGITGRP